MIYINILLLLFILIYGLAVGLKNVFIRIYSILTLTHLNQSLSGRLLDAGFIVSILYLYFFQLEFITFVISKIN